MTHGDLSLEEIDIAPPEGEEFAAADLLCLLPSWPKRRILELAPAFWKQTSEQQDTQQRLAANIFRALTLTEHASTM